MASKIDDQIRAQGEIVRQMKKGGKPKGEVSKSWCFLKFTATWSDFLPSSKPFTLFVSPCAKGTLSHTRFT